MDSIQLTPEQFEKFQRLEQAEGGRQRIEERLEEERQKRIEEARQRAEQAKEEEEKRKEQRSLYRRQLWLKSDKYKEVEEKRLKRRTDLVRSIRSAKDESEAIPHVAKYEELIKPPKKKKQPV